MVKFWDSRTCTQLQSFEAHGADVLCLVVGPVSSATTVRDRWLIAYRRELQCTRLESTKKYPNFL
jgi:hypothetical protein